jgi:predicted MFS family arabinose efflux permease
MGVGMSGNLMVVLTLLAAWFSVDKFAFLGGLVISIGCLGNLLAATPLALLAARMGWRGTFMVFALVNTLIAVLFLWMVRDRPPGRPRPEMTTKGAFKGLRQLMGMYNYWAIGISNFFRYGYFAALQSLWAGPFLMYGLGLGQIAAGNAIFAMGLGYMTGLPLFGRISDRYLRSRKKVILPTMLMFCLLIITIRFWNIRAPMVLILATFFLMGFFASPGQIMYAHFKELLPPEMTARAFTMVNIFPSLGTAMLTHFLGWVIPGEASLLRCPADFNMLWYVGAAGLGLACTLYSAVPDSTALRRQN